MTDAQDTTLALNRAALRIAEAENLLITAGAGMGVDSGLPDFRGTEGFWRAYPPYKSLNLHFEDLANPFTFSECPELAWGFYGHRLSLYRTTIPHDGFSVLLRWASKKRSAFVYTSNVDGQFAKAGFAESGIYEVHGSIHHLQCTRPCSPSVWPADGVTVSVDERTMLAQGPLPKCPRCGALARPNILMFGDGAYLSTRDDGQCSAFQAFLSDAKGPTVVVECGAGTAIPTVRNLGERVAAAGSHSTLVRVNVREPEGPAGTIGVAMGALAAIGELEKRVARMGS